MDVSEIATTIRTELGTVEAALRQGLTDEMARKFETQNTGMAEIRTQLNTLMEKGESPADQRVKDLETKLAEIETSHREIQLKAAQLQLSSEDRKTEADEALFKGQFVKDTGKLRQVLRELRQVGEREGGSRAIDSSLFATGGKLSPETADRFIDYLIQKQVALSRVTTRRMMNPQGHVDILAVARRKIRRAVEGIEPGENADAFSTKRRTMTTVEIIWPEDLTLTFLEDNIERRGVEGHIGQMLATQFGNDLNDLAWNGNEAADSSGDEGFTPINNGWIKLMIDDAEVNDVNAATISDGISAHDVTPLPTNTQILAAAFRALPVEFKSMPSLLYFVPIPFAERYAEEVATRETPLGDQVVVSGFPALRYFGHQVLPEPHLWETNENKLVLTPAENLYFGVQRQIMVDSEWRPRKRAVEFTLTARIDYEYSTGKAIVLVSGIPSHNR